MNSAKHAWQQAGDRRHSCELVVTGETTLKLPESSNGWRLQVMNLNLKESFRVGLLHSGCMVSVGPGNQFSASVQGGSEVELQSTSHCAVLARIRERGLSSVVPEQLAKA